MDLLNLNDENQNEVTDVVRIKRKTTIPQRDVEILSISEDVIKVWDESLINLLWTNKQDFTSLITQYRDSFNERVHASTTRNPFTQRAMELDKQINIEIEYVKNYISEKWGKSNAVAYYSQFGIVKTKSYKLPSNRESRLQALNQLIKAMSDHQLETMQYGTEHWTAIRDEYSNLMQNSKSASGNVSMHASNKRQFKEQACKTLNCLIYALKANYPNDYEARKRVWGFQKEKY